MVTAAAFILQTPRKCDFLYISGPGWGTHIRQLWPSSMLFSDKTVYYRRRGNRCKHNSGNSCWLIHEAGLATLWKEAVRQATCNASMFCGCMREGQAHSTAATKVKSIFFCGLLFGWLYFPFLVVSSVAQQTVARHQLNTPTRIVEKCKSRVFIQRILNFSQKEHQFIAEMLTQL